MTTCNYSLMINKQPIPRTCAICGLGPCKKIRVEIDNKDCQPALADFRVDAIDPVDHDHQVAQQEQPADKKQSFEAWAKSHGGLPLDLANGAQGRRWLFCTYRDTCTEIAWRAWANKPVHAQQEQPADPQPSREAFENWLIGQFGDCARQYEEPMWIAWQAAIDAQQEQPQAPAMVPAQHAVYDAKLGKVIQCHPFNDAGERKVRGLIRILSEGNPGVELKAIVLYMKDADR